MTVHPVAETVRLASLEVRRRSRYALPSEHFMMRTRHIVITTDGFPLTSPRN
jgi:hypothetical protein